MKRLGPAVLVAVTLAACTSTTGPTTTLAGLPATSGAEKVDPGFYLMLMWHQHQPFYPKDGDGFYTRPWVRVHATKDYHDMAAILEDYPGVNATFNLTPVLLRQLEDLAAGAKDIYQVKAEVPADRLADEDKLFLLERFFDINPRIIERFPRYRQLADSRATLGIDGALAAWEVDDFRDLQMLFNLGWTDPDFLKVEPLSVLVARGAGFTEEDKAVLFAEHLRIVGEVVPLHARLWEEGVIEVTTTPLAHPILPLIADTNMASAGDPTALLPENRFQEVVDGDQQVIRGLDEAERLLGRRPIGMWPGEGSVAQPIMGLFSKNGVRWVASGEEVLARTVGIGSFSRDSADLVQEGDLLYRPWSAVLTRNPNVPMFFRDGVLSDLIGFQYSGTPGEAAAADLMERLRRIRDSLDVEKAAAEGQPYVVSVILDGENAWEHYENDGKEFLHALYRNLSEADWVGTTTPSQYLERFGEPETFADDVWPGAWFQPNFATWIGEKEEADAWDYLWQARQDLRRAERSGEVSEEAFAAAFELMLFAEGSDWFWWYGDDQDSGDDAYFDRAFRELIGQMYDALGVERPSYVAVPIIPERPVVADVSPGDLVTIQLDGRLDDWEAAGRYQVSPDAAYLFAFDRDYLYLGWSGPTTPVLVYLGAPSGDKSALSATGEVLGFAATHLLVWDGDRACLHQPVPSSLTEECVTVSAAAGPSGVEVAVPLGALGPIEPGDMLLAKAVLPDAFFPGSGPMAFQVPDISDVQVFLDIEDPLGDDHGPGSYRYPTDPVFVPGSYDLTRFQVGTEDDQLVLSFEVAAAIQNPWGSPRGLSVQTFDVYIDTSPGGGTGERLLLPGRNASLPDGYGWEYAVTIEGWAPALFAVRPDGTIEETTPSLSVVTFGERGKVVVRLPVSLLGSGDPATWGYAALVLSQEGFPSSGVRRVRDVEVNPQQWRIGGAPAGSVSHTRIVDVAWSEAGEQERLLLGFTPMPSLDGLGPADFGEVPVAVVGGAR